VFTSTDSTSPSPSDRTKSNSANSLSYDQKLWMKARQ
jgi:hypothetical protein